MVTSGGLDRRPARVPRWAARLARTLWACTTSTGRAAVSRRSRATARASRAGPLARRGTARVRDAVGGEGVGPPAAVAGDAGLVTGGDQVAGEVGDDALGAAGAHLRDHGQRAHQAPPRLAA